MICTKCHIDKDESEFYKSNRDGIFKRCKCCIREIRREYYNNNKEKCRIHEKSEKRLLYNKSDARKLSRKKWELNHPLYRSQYKKEYRKTQRHKESVRKQFKRLRRENVNYKIAANIRNRIRDRIKKQAGEKVFGMYEYIGCSIDFLRKYLESLWEDGMNWGNYNFYGWHIDHIIPCSSFDLTKKEEQLKCFHYTNLQPLWCEDNLKKGAKLLVA